MEKEAKEGLMAGMEECRIVINLRTLIAAMDSTMHMFREFGAEDSEPQYELQRAMALALTYGIEEVPKSGSAWELYSSSMKCGVATRKITQDAKLLVRFIIQHRNNPDVKNIVTKYCHRVL